MYVCSSQHDSQSTFAVKRVVLLLNYSFIFTYVVHTFEYFQQQNVYMLCTRSVLVKQSTWRSFWPCACIYSARKLAAPSWIVIKAYVKCGFAQICANPVLNKKLTHGFILTILQSLTVGQIQNSLHASEIRCEGCGTVSPPLVYSAHVHKRALLLNIRRI